MIRSKKNFGAHFLEIFHFLFSKVESASVYASGSKTHVATPQGYLKIPKSQKKFILFPVVTFFSRTIAKKTREGRKFFFFNLLSCFSICVATKATKEKAQKHSSLA